MKTGTLSVSEMSDLEQRSAVGGNLAYDIGRGIRFVCISLSEGGSPCLSGIGVAMAVGDWIAHSA
jgi:hypothetical protein